MRDEFDRPLTVLDDLLPAKRAAAVDGQSFKGAGRFVSTLRALDEVTTAGGDKVEVLSVRQALEARPEPGARPLQGRLSRAVRGVPAKGRSTSPASSRPLPTSRRRATARAELTAQGDARTAVPAGRCRCRRRGGGARAAQSLGQPWQFPALVREMLTEPVRAAGLSPPVSCNVPWWIQVYMTCDRGVLVPLANYTLRPIEKLTLTIRTPQKVAGAERLDTARWNSSAARTGVSSFRCRTRPTSCSCGLSRR